MENAVSMSPPAHSAQKSAVELSDLEQHYPRIVEKLVSIWNLPDCESYLYDLSIDVRGGREGFGQEVIGDILSLFNIKADQRGDVWKFWIPDNPYYEELNASIGKGQRKDVF